MKKLPSQKTMDVSKLNPNKVTNDEIEGIENALNLFISLRDSEAILPTSYFEQIDFYNKHGDSKIRPKTGRRSYQQIISEQKLAWLASEAKSFLGNGKALDKRIDKKELAARKKDLCKDLIKFTKDELIEQYAILTLRLDQANAELTVQKEINSYLSGNLLQTLSHKQKIGGNKTSGVNKKYASNNACMKICLAEVLAANPKEKWATKETFKKFCAHTKKKFPKPPYKQKQRQTKEEKLQDLKIQKADLDATSREGWADSTLRDYFERKMRLTVANLQ